MLQKSKPKKILTLPVIPPISKSKKFVVPKKKEGRNVSQNRNKKKKGKNFTHPKFRPYRSKEVEIYIYKSDPMIPDFCETLASGPKKKRKIRIGNIYIYYIKKNWLTCATVKINLFKITPLPLSKSRL